MVAQYYDALAKRLSAAFDIALLPIPDKDDNGRKFGNIRLK